MIKYTRLSMLGLAAVFLAACSFTHQPTSGYFAKKSIKQEKLANGTPVQVGWMKPTGAWQCTQVDTHSWNWALMKTQGMVSLSPYTVFNEKALEYASQKNLKINYISLRAPNEFDLGALNVTAFSKAVANYYQCKKINPQ